MRILIGTFLVWGSIICTPYSSANNRHEYNIILNEGPVRTRIERGTREESMTTSEDLTTEQKTDSSTDTVEDGTLVEKQSSGTIDETTVVETDGTGVLNYFYEDASNLKNINIPFNTETTAAETSLVFSDWGKFWMIRNYKVSTILIEGSKSAMASASSFIECRYICHVQPACQTVSMIANDAGVQCEYNNYAIHQTRLEKSDGAWTISKGRTENYTLGTDGFLYVSMGSMNFSDANSSCHQHIPEASLPVVKSKEQLYSLQRAAGKESQPWINLVDGVENHVSVVKWEGEPAFHVTRQPAREPLNLRYRLNNQSAVSSPQTDTAPTVCQINIGIDQFFAQFTDDINLSGVY